MKDNKKGILINIIVICLYFLWPYFFALVSNLLSFSEKVNLYVSLSINFIFLLIVIYIYKDILKKYYGVYRKDFKKKFFNALKIFVVCLFIYAVLNLLLNVLGVSIPNNKYSMVETFKKIPVMFVLNTLFYYPIIEELIFKMSFKEIFKNKWSFIIITGVFNALFQIVFSFNNLTDLLYLLPYSVFFGSLSYIYYKTDNIVYPIFLRMCYNLIPCIIYMVDLLH